VGGNRISSPAALSVLAAAAIAVLSVFAGPALALAGERHAPAGQTSAEAAPASGLTIASTPAGNPIPPGFLGLSVEPKGLAHYAGTNPRAVDPPFLQLIRDIAPNQSPVLRIGGDGTDWTWWPVPHMRRPPGVKYDLTPQWMSVARTVATTLHAHLILGINLEADSRRVAAAEAQAMISRIGRQAIDALEIGNEPELYGVLGWYRSASGQHILGRSPGYDFADYAREFAGIAHVLPTGVALAAPSTGAPTWLDQLGTFLPAEPRVRLVTLHAYPLENCVPGEVATVSELLSNQSSRGLADGLEPYVATARAHGVRVRVDEMNGVTCGGARGVSDTFTSALWALDTLFEMARVGVDGVNFHTVTGKINEMLVPSFTHGRWQMRVHPEYYGLIMFAQAAPPGSRLLALSGTPAIGVKVWATRAPDRTVRVVLINKHLVHAEYVRLRIPSTRAPATVEQLRAPSMTAKSGVTLGGQTMDPQTSTGVLAGRAKLVTLAPSAGTYRVRLPAASATMLTLRR